jgi:hypothetical protein
LDDFFAGARRAAGAARFGGRRDLAARDLGFLADIWSGSERLES